jgi:anaerobic ribonucleoside-triphosphate reductase
MELSTCRLVRQRDWLEDVTKESSSRDLLSKSVGIRSPLAVSTKSQEVEQMNWPSIIVPAGWTTVLLAGLAFVSKNWIKTRLNENIAHEYRKALEKFKESLEWQSQRCEQATEIAELISFWVVKNYDRTLDENMSLYHLQRKYWELALWLDAPVLRDLNKAFTGDQFATLRYKEALIAVRKAIVVATDDIRSEELIHWNPINAPTGRVSG